MISDRFLLWLARAGLAGRGVVFLILGGFAASASLGQGSRPVGTTGALHVLIASPAGWAAVVPIAVGLFCFAIFRALEAIFDVHGYGGGLRGGLRRAALGAAGISYVALAVIAAAIVSGWPVATDPDQKVRGWTAWLLSIPGGDWIVGIAGLITVCVGVGLAVGALRGSFNRRLRVDRDQRPYVTALGTVGLLSRAVIFVLIGAFLVFAAVTANPNDAEGFGGALRAVQRQPYGDWLLGITALGFLAFGLFGLGEAVFAEIKRGKR